MKAFISLALVSGLTLALSACVVAPNSGSVYNARQAQNEQSVRMASVESVREVTIDKGSSGTGTLAATLFSSIGNVLVIKVRQQSSNVLLTMAWAMLWGSTLVALWALASGQPWRLPSTPSYWMGLVYLAIFGSVIAFNAYFTLIDRIGSHKAVYIGVVTPVISVLLSIQLEHYRPGPIEWAGMLLCLSSVAWALRAPPAAAPDKAPAQKKSHVLARRGETHC